MPGIKGRRDFMTEPEQSLENIDTSGHNSALVLAQLKIAFIQKCDDE